MRRGVYNEHTEPFAEEWGTAWYLSQLRRHRSEAARRWSEFRAAVGRGRAAAARALALEAELDAEELA